jgi:hypothetical protein
LFTHKEGIFMKSTILDARTVAIVRDLKVEKRQGANGEFESKDILVRIAVDRDYKVTRTENGKTISEYPTDFWLAKLTGNVAQVFADHCTATKEDGKLVSRHLLLSGNFENYTNTRKVKVAPQVNINGALYQLDLEVEVPNNSNTIFVVDSLKFLDRNPENVQANNGSTVVTTASITPVGVAQPAPAVASVAPVATAPVAPVAPQAVAVAPVATQAVDFAGAMNAPVVDPNFVPAGQTAPF